jgi:hypothetical protein
MGLWSNVILVMDMQVNAHGQRRYNYTTLDIEANPLYHH